MRIFGCGIWGKPDASSATPPAAAPGETANPRLERLVARARALLLFERSWRLLVPPLIVIGLFICLSWTGVWLETPHWARAVGVGAFALALGLSLLPLRNFHSPSRREALERIDRVSGLSQRPAAVLDDRLGNAGEDAATLAFWSLHRRRAERAVALLRTGLPSPRAVDIDRYALRAAVLVGLIAAGFIAGPEKYARVAAAFDWRFGGLGEAGQRIDAWVDPPAYTGRPPIVLTRHGAPAQRIEAPTGSIVVIRGSAGKPGFEASGALAQAAHDAAASAPNAPAQVAPAQAAPPATKATPAGEARLVLKGDAKLTINSVGAFEFAAIPDNPPTITLTDPPRPNARGSLTLKYAITDDYGAIGAEAAFANPVMPDGKPAKRSLVDPPKASLQIPPAGSEEGDAETTIDLSDHPWAGAKVEMTLVAHDEGGNEGKSAPVTVTLPQKPFVKPLARALVEQRRNLILDPDDRGRVSTALDALMIEPDAFDVSAGVYLGLRVASQRLAAASTDADLVDVADYLWQMALRIENGDLSDAERDLRAAQQQLREALQRGASPEELKQLSDNLRAAMDKFLREFAEQQQKEMDKAHQGADRSQSPGKTVSQKDLQAMLDKMQEMARNGDTEGAQKMLEQMQNILENLKMARPRNADPASREMSRALNELDQMSKQQQDLRDETYQNGEAAKHQQRRQRNQMDSQGEEQFGQSPLDGDNQDQDDNSQDDAAQAPPPPATPQGKDQNDLQQRQQALRDRLEQLQQRLNKAGHGETGLSEAQKAMEDAQKSLGEGARGSDSAVEAQGRAIDAMREGAQKLAQAMRDQGEGQGEGQPGEGEAEGEGEGQQGQFGQNGDDPLGRPAGREHAFNPSAKYDPMGVPAAERAQRVLEELRRRLSEPFRPREETDYLERLLRRY
ncbi:TIGR02302 family protein [Methylocella sp.]|uniref:TIGR02302 family protein n=1 Tax=Methylocella sp. TaxID=1978226 RepID=UPI003C254823